MTHEEHNDMRSLVVWAPGYTSSHRDDFTKAIRDARGQHNHGLEAVVKQGGHYIAAILPMCGDEAATIKNLFINNGLKVEEITDEQKEKLFKQFPETCLDPEKPVITREP